jgi:hypothetical protein
MLALCTKFSYRPLDIDLLKRMIITSKPRLFPLGFEWWQPLPFPPSNRTAPQDLIEGCEMVQDDSSSSRLSLLAPLE